jgi:hypothetical protein
LYPVLAVEDDANERAAVAFADLDRAYRQIGTDKQAIAPTAKVVAAQQLPHVAQDGIAGEGFKQGGGVAGIGRAEQRRDDFWKL